MASRAVITVGSVATGEVAVAVSGVVDRSAVGELDRQLLVVLGSPGVSVVLVDLAGARRCDYRVLEVLDHARRELAARGGVLHIRGVDPHALTGFGAASLPALLSAYRVSLDAAGRTAPWEPGGSGVTGVCSAAEHRLARTCAALAGPTFNGDGGGTAEVADRLTEHCAAYLSGVAAVVLFGARSGPPAVVSASTVRARLVELSGAAAGQGPGVECLRRGELVSAPDLSQLTDRWAGYTRAANLHGFAASRALPIRRPAATRPGRGAPLLGALVLLTEFSGPMAPTDLGIAQSFADLAAVAIAGSSDKAPRSPAEQRGDTAGPTVAEHTAAVQGAAALADRVLIEQAKGILVERGNLTMAQAEDGLQRHAHHRDLSITEVAREVLAGRLLTRVDLADDGVTPGADDGGVERPRRLVAGGAVVGLLVVCSVW